MTLQEIKTEIENRIAEDKKCFCCGKDLTSEDFKIVPYCGFRKDKTVCIEFYCNKCGYDEHGDYWNIKRAM